MTQDRHNRRAKITQAPSESRALRKSIVALSISSALLATATVHAEELELDTLQIEERAIDVNPYTEDGAPYKARISGDRRRVEELAETPQTIVVITQEEIKDSGNTDLKQILVDQPGITLGTGENGNAFGDRYIIRGHEARSDVFVDGLRDPGMTTRESFAVDQIEVTKGPSSTFAGRGATGGAVNSITKQASTEYDFSNADVSIGSDNHKRITFDVNEAISDTAALRLNTLYSSEDVPERAPAKRERLGFALSATKDLSDASKLTGDIYYLDAEDKPDLGTYTQSDGAPVKDIPVYLQDEDFLTSEVATGTLRFEHDFTDNVSFSNALRYGTSKNGYFVTGARGTTATYEVTNDDGSTASVTADNVGLSSHQGWQDVSYLANQANVFIDTEIAGKKHQFIVGLEYTDLGVENGVYDYTTNGASNCSAGRYSFCIYDQDGNQVDNLNSLMQRRINKGDIDADLSIETISLYAMDTFDVTDKLTLSGGIRVDSFDYQNDAISRGQTEPTTYAYSDDLFNGHLGAVFKVDDNVNFYANYGTATNINGGELDVGNNCGYGGVCADSTTADNLDDVKPEKTENIEIGTKWNLNDDKLLFSASVFQITKDDVMQGAGRGQDYSSVGAINTGKNRVEGVEFGLVGNLTDKLSTQLGFTMMNSEILESTVESDIGQPLSNFAEDSAHAQLRYQLTPQFALGAAATYSSEVAAGQPDDNGSTSIVLPSYTYYDAFATYKYSDQLKATLNVGNITGEDYYVAAYRSGSFTYLGDARNAKLTVSYKF